jgi:large subunit ribosomal protein L15
MKYHELDTTPKKSAKRVGRGIAAGQGKTAGRGTKGQGARTGSSKRPGFEGGQNPLMQRLPKLRGFRSFKPKAENVYTDQLLAIGAKVDNKSLADNGLVSSEYVAVKLLFRGEVSQKVTVELQGASTHAVDALQAAGGSFTKVPRPMRQSKKQDNK